MTEPLIQSLAQTLYGQQPTLTRFWSEVNDVYLLTFPHVPDKVIKCARTGRGDGIRREQAILRSLARTTIPVPPIEFTQDDHPAPVAFTLMPRIAQRHLGEWHGAAPSSPAVAHAYHQLGHFLAQLHQLAPDAVPGTRTLPEAWISERERLTRLCAQRDQYFPTSAPARQVLDRVRHLLQHPPTSFVHHDLHSANALVDGQGICALIDWENAGPGYPLCDLARCLACTRTWGGHADDILTGYQHTHPLNPAAHAELTTWHAYAILDFALSYAASNRPEAATEILSRLTNQTTSP